MKNRLIKQLLPLVVIISVILQSASPFLFSISPKAYAEEVIVEDQVTATETTPAPVENVVEETQQETIEEAVEVTAQIEDPVEEIITPEEASSTPPQEPTDESVQEQVVSQVEQVKQETMEAVILENVPTENIDVEVMQGQSASLLTDQEDYSPTDTVILTGSNLTPNTHYVLLISSSNSPPVSFSADITSDKDGIFVFTYQLDGNYRPDYKAELQDQLGNIISSTVFTDSRTVDSIRLNGKKKVTVASGEQIKVKITVSTDWFWYWDDNWKSTDWRIGNSGSWTCVNHSNHINEGTYSESFYITAPEDPGVYKISFHAYKDNDCSKGQSDKRTINNAITVIEADSMPPVISMVGTSPVTVEAGSIYSDEGATAWDDIDGDLTTSIIVNNPVNTSVLGTYKVTYNVSDSSANAAMGVERIVQVVDTTAPTVVLNSPKEGAVLKGIVEIYGSIEENLAMGNYNVAVYPGTANFMDFSKRLEQKNVDPANSFSNQKIYSWDTAKYSDGEYFIRLAARDKAGNRTLASGQEYTGRDDSQHVIKVAVDNTIPTATVSYSITTLTNKDVIAIINPSEPVTITNNGGSNKHTFTENGSFTFNFEDLAGNTGSVIATVNNIDKIAPDVEITSSTGSIYSGNVAIKGSVSDSNPHHYWLVIQNLSGTKVAGPGTVIYTTPFTDKLLLNWDSSKVPDGEYKIVLSARDAADNKDTGSTVSKNINIDNTDPSGTITYSTTDWTSDNVLVTLSLSEPATVINNGGSDTYTFINNGSFTFDFTDLAGNVGSKTATVNNIDRTAPSKPVSTPDAGNYYSDQFVNLTSSDSESGLGEIYYTTNGSTPDQTSTLYSNSSPILIAQNMTIKTIAFDQVGNPSDIMEAEYNILPPIISEETFTRADDDSLTVNWITDHPATSRVVYDTIPHSLLGSAPNYGYTYSTVEDPTKVTSHSVTITGLNVNQTYYYRVISHGSPEAVGPENPYATYYVFGLPGDGQSDGRSDGKSSGGGTGGAGVLGVSTGLEIAFASGTGGGAVLGASSETKQEVLGEKDSITPEQVVEEVNKTEAAIASASWTRTVAQILAGLVILIFIIYFFLRRRKSSVS